MYSLGFLLFQIGTLARIGSFGIDGIWSNCSLWLLWALALGPNLACAALIYRYNLLYCHGIARNPTKFQLWGPVLIPSLIMIFLLSIFQSGITSEGITPQPVESEQHPGLYYCQFIGQLTSYSLYAVLGSQLAVLLYFNWLTSRLLRVFTQFKELQIVLVVIIFNILVQMIVPIAYKEIFYLTWFQNLMSSFALVAVILGPPIFWYFVNPRGYEKKLFEKRKNLGLSENTLAAKIKRVTTKKKKVKESREVKKDVAKGLPEYNSGKVVLTTAVQKSAAVIDQLDSK